MADSGNKELPERGEELEDLMQRCIEEDKEEKARKERAIKGKNKRRRRKRIGEIQEIQINGRKTFAVLLV